MPPITDCQASFQNSRVKPRAPTAVADTGNVTPIAAAGGLPTLVKPADANRTYLTIRNIGTTNLRYGYFPRITLNVDGFQLRPGDAFDIDAPGDVYAVNEAGPAGGEICWDQGTG